MPRRKSPGKEYLIAEPSGLPGVRIPLLSEEECKARGIEPARFSPRETWTQAQRDAVDRLAEILLPRAYLEAVYVIQAELGSEGTNSTNPELKMLRAAARRSIALIDAGKWKQKDTWVHFPPSWIREILEMFSRGDLSLSLAPQRTQRKRSRAKARSSAP